MNLPISVLCPRRFAPLFMVLLAASSLALQAQQTAAKSGAKPFDQRKNGDFAQLYFYGEDDAKLAAGPADPTRVVFLGDSITENWGNKKYSSLFQTHTNFIDRGISGQTTSQMLLRYRQDVLTLNPRIVVLFGGINDFTVAKVTDPMVTVEQNIPSIVELALLHRQRVILCSILPVSDAIQTQTDRRDPDKIIALNAWLKSYAARMKLQYVDFYSVLTDGHDRIQTSLTVDGLHPNHAGMEKMDPLIEAAIATELAKP